MSASVLAKRLGRSRADIANTIRLLELPDQAIEMINSGELSKGHGKVLLTEPDHERRRVLARRSAESGWSVRTLESEIRRRGKSPKQQHQPHPDQSAAAVKLEHAILRASGCEAQAKPHRNGFRIILDQAAAERLARASTPTAHRLRDLAQATRAAGPRSAWNTHPYEDAASRLPGASFGESIPRWGRPGAPPLRTKRKMPWSPYIELDDHLSQRRCLAVATLARQESRMRS